MQPLPLLKPPALKRVVDNLGLAEWSTGEDRVSGCVGCLESSGRVPWVDKRASVTERLTGV